MFSAAETDLASDPAQPLLYAKAGASHANAAYGTDHDEARVEGGRLNALSAERTTILQEMGLLGKNSAPLIVTYLLQYGLSFATISLVGHLGTDELAAVALAFMTANITGFAVYE